MKQAILVLLLCITHISAQALEANNNLLNKAHNTLETQNASLEQSSHSLKSENKNLEQNNLSLEDKNKALESANKALEAQNEDLSEQAIKLKTLITAHKQEIETLKSQSPETRDSGLHEEKRKQLRLAYKQRHIIIKQINSNLEQIYSNQKQINSNLDQINSNLDQIAINGGENPLNLQLYRAMQKDDVITAEKLIKKGANIHFEKDKGRPLINLTTYYDSPKVLELLLKNGADVHSIDKTNNLQPLHRVAYSGDVEMAKVLLKHGASIRTEVGKHKYTPMKYAAEQNQREILYLFLNYGLKRKEMLSYMKNAIHGTRIIVLLDQIGAKVGTEQNNKAEIELEMQMEIFCIEPELKNKDVCTKSINSQ